jgi:predicted nucleic acid-binding protein
VTVFVDTSALIALLDGDEARHAETLATWKSLLDAGRPLLTSNYVVLEAVAVAQRRLGLGAVEALHGVFFPLMQIAWVDETLHMTAVAALLGARRRSVSLVDHVCFALMRARGVRSAFALDPHFAKQGFEVLPAADPDVVAERL